MSELTKQDRFEAVCNTIETTEIGVLKACKINNIGYETFVGMMIGNEALQIRYARAKELQVETLINKIPTLHQQCLDEIRTIDDPKRVNAIQNAYKEQVRHIEWIASKLKAKKYGDKLDITTDGQSLVRNMTLTPIPSKSNSDIQLSNVDNSDGQ